MHSAVPGQVATEASEYKQANMQDISVSLTLPLVFYHHFIPKNGLDVKRKRYITTALFKQLLSIAATSFKRHTNLY